MRCFIESRLCALALTAFLLAGLAGCSKKAVDQRKPAEVTFYWTAQADGRLEPCGCFTGQHGGLTRVSTLLNSPDAASADILADVGNAITGTADYQIIQYRYMQQAFASMHYAALNIGEREAQLSATELKRLRDASPVPMISANLVERGNGQRIFPPYRIVETHGYRVALIGVVDNMPADAVGEGLAVEPMRSALAKVLPEIKSKADAIVLLAFADEATMRTLADTFYELDLILGGMVKEPSQHLARQNRSVLLWTTNETKALGMFKAALGGRERFAAKDFSILFVNDQIPQDEKLGQLAQTYRDEIRRTALTVDDPTHARDDDVPGVKPAAGYAGSESCEECHTQAYKIWKQTGHAQAFRSLVARKSDADPNCVGCHSVGFGTPTGYRREWQGKKLANVGCENCHGPGSVHVAERLQQRKEMARIDSAASQPVSGSDQPTKEKMRASQSALSIRLNAQPTQPTPAMLFHYRPVGATDCTACHYGEFSRPFEYDSFWTQIKHGKEPGPITRR